MSRTIRNLGQRVLGSKRLARFRRLGFWWALLGVGLVASRLVYGVWFAGVVPGTEVAAGFAPAVNPVTELTLHTLVRVPLAVLLASEVKWSAFEAFETREFPILSGLVWIGIVLAVVLS